MVVDAKYLLVLCTCPDEPCAGRIARALVDERLAACVNIIPGITSVYRWKDGVESDREVLLLAKSDTRRYPGLEARVRALHPYEVPEIIATTLSAGLPAYLAWIGESLEDSP